MLRFRNEHSLQATVNFHFDERKKKTFAQLTIFLELVDYKPIQY